MDLQSKVSMNSTKMVLFVWRISGIYYIGFGFFRVLQAFEKLERFISDQFGSWNERFQNDIPQGATASAPVGQPVRSSTTKKMSASDDLDVETVDLIEGHLDTLRKDFKDYIEKGRPLDAEVRELLGQITNGIHDLKLYQAPPVEDKEKQHLRDGTTTKYKFVDEVHGVHVLPLATVQEIFELDKALRENLVRSGNNLNVANFYMRIVSSNIFIFLRLVLIYMKTKVQLENFTASSCRGEAQIHQGTEPRVEDFQRHVRPIDDSSRPDVEKCRWTGVLRPTHGTSRSPGDLRPSWTHLRPTEDG